MNHDNHEPPHQTPGVPNGPQQRPGHRRPDDLSTSPETTPSTYNAEEPQRDPALGFSADELRNNPVLLAQVTAYLQENHLHLPMLTPDINDMKEMRKNTPELYRAYVKAVNSQIDADYTARTAPYKEPGKVARRGQYSGLIAVVAVLLFCGYLAFLGHVLSASLIAAFDLVALAAVFASGNQENDNDSGSRSD